MSEQQGRDRLSTTLRELRQRAGLSGSEAAQRIGVPQPRISEMEHGRWVPRETEINKLADLYGAKATIRRQLLRAVWDLQSEPARPG